MRRDLILFFSLVLTAVSCGTTADYVSQQRFQDGIYAKPAQKPVTVAIYTKDEIAALAARNIAKKDTIVIITDHSEDNWGWDWNWSWRVNPYWNSPWHYGFGYDPWYWNRWHFGGWYSSAWAWDFYYDWYSPWYGGWYSPWYYDSWYCGWPYYGYGYGWPYYGYGYRPYYGYGGWGHGPHYYDGVNHSYTPRSRVESYGRGGVRDITVPRSATSTTGTPRYSRTSGTTAGASSVRSSSSTGSSYSGSSSSSYNRSSGGSYSRSSSSSSSRSYSPSSSSSSSSSSYSRSSSSSKSPRKSALSMKS